MKPWAEMTAGARFGVVGGVAAVIAALFWGAWSVRGVPPAAEEAAPADAAATGSGEAASAAEGEAAADGSASTDAASDAGAGEAAAADGAASDGAGEAVAANGTAAATDEAAADAGAAVADGTATADGTGADDAAVAAAAAGADAAPADADGTAAAPDAADVEAADAGDAGAVAAEVPAAPAPVPPSFDLVRVERDGAALVAGKAAPSSMLSLRVTGAEIALVPADGQGNFVAMFNLAPSNAPRVLSLVMRLADGTEVPAEGSVVIAPTVAPAAVAAGEAEAAVAEAPVVAEAPAALLVTDEGAKVLQTADTLPAELVANVTVDTITYTPEGAVQLAGRGTADRAVRVYLDNAPVADASISAAGDWSVTLPDVAPGIYTLRADQLDEAGKVTSRFETPFKRETEEALAAASGAGAEQAAASGAETAVAEDVAAEASGEAAGDTAAPLTVTVQPGFTLWKIATDNLGEGVRYVQVFEANKDQIRDPDLIYPGQVFTIPQGE